MVEHPDMNIGQADKAVCNEITKEHAKTMLQKAQSKRLYGKGGKNEKIGKSKPKAVRRKRQKPQGRVKGIEMQQAQDIMGMLRVNPKAKPKPQPKLPQKRKRKQKDAETSDDEFLFSDDDPFESPKKKRRYKQESDSDFEPDAPPVKRSRKRKTESSGEDLLPKKRRRT